MYNSRVEVTFGPSVTRIPAYLFYSMSGTTPNVRIATVNIGENVTYIGRYAFDVMDTFFTEANFANEAGWFVSTSSTATSGTNISATVLSVVSLAAQYLRTTYASYYWHYNPQIIEDFTFNNGELVSYTGSDAEVEIPNTYSTAVINGETVFVEGDTYAVTAIADGDLIPASGTITGAFYNNRTITSVVIPDTVTRIGDYAFSNCSNLESVTMPNDLEEIGFRAFNGCESLTGITFVNSLQSIESYAFYGCTSLTTLTMPASLNFIGTYAFSGAGLTSVTFLETNGWTAGTTSLSASSLAAGRTAATYLTSTYVSQEWTRS